MSFGEHFLVYPDLFPARASGEPWGQTTIRLQCVGGPYRISGLSTTQADAIRERFKEFCHADTGASASAVELRVFATAEHDFIGASYADGYYSFDTDYAPAAIRLAGRDFMARLDWRPELSAALWTPQDRELIAYGDFENVFRVLVAQRLLDRGGLLLHSSGVVIDGGAHIFFGYSGAGKTTVARLGLAHGYGVLSDDLDLLTLTEDGPRAARSPFAGQLGRTWVPEASYRIHGLYQLVQGEENTLRPLGQAQAVCALAARSPFVNRDPYRAERLIDNLTALTRAVPVSVLTFKRAGGFWDLLHRGSHTP